MLHLRDVGDAVVLRERSGPVLGGEAVGDEVHVLVPPAALDEIAGQRVALRVAGQHVGGIVAHREPVGKGDAAAGGQKLDQ
ncbi:MAG: hypothetical protein ACK55I_46920, partial [bacterium]